MRDNRIVALASLTGLKLELQAATRNNDTIRLEEVYNRIIAAFQGLKPNGRCYTRETLYIKEIEEIKSDSNRRRREYSEIRRRRENAKVSSNEALRKTKELIKESMSRTNMFFENRKIRSDV